MPPGHYAFFLFHAIDDPHMSARTEADTIAAIATPPGRGGVGIVRVSGPRAAAIAAAMLQQMPRPRRAEYLPFVDAEGAVIDEGIALYFPAPNSFTGEDVLELQGHGGPVVMDLLLAAVLKQGARIAQPGEFSQRAFLNDKIDLAQAEAIADLIDSASEQAARAALRSLQGEFSQRIHELVEALVMLRMFVESAIDFPEEEIDFLAEGDVVGRLRTIREQLLAVQASARQGNLLREGMTIVLAGQPNAGKSSLLNALAGREAAIVTEIPGTTRDVLREYVHIDGMPLHVIDTAGLRDSEDPVEREGVRRAWAEIERADGVLLIVDARDGVTAADQAIVQRLPSQLPLTLVYNKIDLTNTAADIQREGAATHIRLSAMNGTGLDLLRGHLKQMMGYQSVGEHGFTARRRHLDALNRAAEHLEAGLAQLQQFHAGELVAEELRIAQEALGEITGAFDADELLGRIFSSFCIGK